MTPLQLRIALGMFAVACAISAVTTAIVRRWATRRGFVDLPGGHKAHLKPVALLGGISIVAAMVLPMLAILIAAHVAQAYGAGWVPANVRIYVAGICSKTPVGLAVIAGAILLHCIGLLDDMRPLSAGPKLLVQVAIAASLVVGLKVRLLTEFGPVVSIVLSMLWIVGLTNAFNFLDNMDGLASGVALIVAGVFAATAMQAGQIFVPACCCLLAGALAGFLPYNVNPASIFMGDAGSLVIGFMISVLTILTNYFAPENGGTPAAVLAPLVVMAVPIYDTTSVLLIRRREGRPLWRADRRHFSHRLLQRGLSVREAAGVIWLATLITALPAVLLPTASWPVAVGILGHTAAVVTLVGYMEKGGAGIKS